MTYILVFAHTEGCGPQQFNSVILDSENCVMCKTCREYR